MLNPAGTRTGCASLMLSPPGACMDLGAKCLTLPGRVWVRSSAIRAGTEFSKHVPAAIRAGTGISKHLPPLKEIMRPLAFPCVPKQARGRTPLPRSRRTRAPRHSRAEAGRSVHSLTSSHGRLVSQTRRVALPCAGEVPLPRMRQLGRGPPPRWGGRQALAVRVSPVIGRESSGVPRRPGVSPRRPAASRGWGCCPAGPRRAGGGTSSGGRHRWESRPTRRRRS